jgi:hypothetical protein
MIFITNYNFYIHGVYKQTYNWGAHIVLLRIRCNTEKYMEKWDLARKIHEFNNDSM